MQEEQLRHLSSVGAPPSVSLGVVPTRSGRSRMPGEGFWIFDTGQVNVELSGYLTLTQPSEVAAAYGDTFKEMAGMAVYGAKARALITTAIQALG